jgi:hypothetical protein
MLGIFLFVAALAGNFRDLDIAAHMPGYVYDLHMTTGACVFAMHGSGKGQSGNLIGVAAKAGSRIDGHPTFRR